MFISIFFNPNECRNSRSHGADGQRQARFHRGTMDWQILWKVSKKKGNIIPGYSWFIDGDSMIWYDVIWCDMIWYDLDVSENEVHPANGCVNRDIDDKSLESGVPYSQTNPHMLECWNWNWTWIKLTKSGLDVPFCLLLSDSSKQCAYSFAQLILVIIFPTLLALYQL